ncbi:DddA-like double-stranded DNA deaminase toxin [Saccharothrix variisporea]|uniref:Nucleic acid/nucleotide deaminase of polymorphic system toxin n=1 Tax=Saccharothrix variisporea TaxID=543527 RepID=A0A495XA56_9PSEU|nr:DddA-like double-stranded DNA deaminase toxin [Saccharothrix variisporea]RKT69493.1 nucleic acid/nucleotide deaminase of polymorphic system toxin [Saccharothrix variisporea]
MASIGAVVAALKAAVEQLPFAALADALDLAQDAKVLIEQAAAGTGRDEFSQVLDSLDKVVEGITHLQGRLTAIQRTTTAAINRMEGHGDTRTVAPQPNQPGSGSAVAGPSGDELPVQVKRLLGVLPQRDERNQKTQGFWVDERGHERGPVTSGQDHLSTQATAELRRLGVAPPRGMLMTADHVEVKVAVQLRGLPDRAVMLVVNNEPCARGPFSCDRLLPRILRPGQTVTVYWPGGVKTYRGRAA